MNRVEALPKSIPNKTKKTRYTGFILQRSILTLQRANRGKYCKVDLDNLYYAYRAHRFINTAVLKKISVNRVNSPSVAILMAIGAIDEFGNRI